MELQDAKITDVLKTKATEASDDDLLDVIVELGGKTPTPSASEGMQGIAEAKQAFHRDASPVESTISEHGGEVTGHAWINRTLRARVPARALSELSKLSSVAAVDAPRKIELE
jgi:hypothetical protein